MPTIVRKSNKNADDRSKKIADMIIKNDQRIQVKISKPIKEMYESYCKSMGTAPSTELRKYVHEQLKNNGYIN